MCAKVCMMGISIHAPREGGDVMATIRDRADTHISIHAPREGGDLEGLQGTQK